MTLFCIEGRYAVPQYSIADDMNVVNTVLRSSLLIPQSLPARLLKTFNLLMSLLIRLFVWALKDRVRSNFIPRNFGWGFTSSSGI